MEINAPNPRTKLRATMARRAGSRDLNNESLNYDAEPEPNMRLSRAIAVVLILHIVAIGGVLAFSLIKDRAPQPSLKTKPAVSTPAATPATVANANVAVAAAAPKRSEAAGAPAERVLAPAALSANATPAAKPVKTTPYTVRTGDTLARVASENSVSLGSLIAANDARVTTTSLKPGQEIQIPAAGAPKDRALAEATRLIEAGGATTPAKQTQVTPKAVMPTTIVGKPSASSLPAPTLIAKSTSSTPTPLPAKINPTTPALEKPSAPTPRIEKALPVSAALKAESGSVSWEDKTYVVVTGDNPNKLAKKFGVTESALLKANGITDPRKLQVGQRLVIPKKKAR